MWHLKVIRINSDKNCVPQTKWTNGQWKCECTIFLWRVAPFFSFDLPLHLDSTFDGSIFEAYEWKIQTKMHWRIFLLSRLARENERAQKIDVVHGTTPGRERQREKRFFFASPLLWCWKNQSTSTVFYWIRLAKSGAVGNKTGIGISEGKISDSRW